MDELHLGIAPDPNPERWFAKLSSTIESREKEWEGFNSNKVWEERFRKRESSLLVKKKLCLNRENVIFEKLKLFKSGKKSFYLKLGEKSWSRSWFKLF